jgi:restriction system protein
LGLLENSSRGVWTLTKNKFNFDEFNFDENQQKLDKDRRKPKSNNTLQLTKDQSLQDIEEKILQKADWKELLLNKLYTLKPDAFERLAQKMLRESGSIEVEVTGRSGDGGIDGKGIVRISGFLSFPVIFQCKRFEGSVTPSQVRDFRGAMQGRTDKGIFLTAGIFTLEARKEATREGAFHIDLIDGDLLCEKLKELNLGVQTQFVENVEVLNSYFDQL